MTVSIFCSRSLQPCQNYVQSPGEGHLELFNLGEVFLGAFFLLFPIEITVRFAVAASSQNYEFGGSISLSYLSYLWRMKLLINQRFICEGVFSCPGRMIANSIPARLVATRMCMSLPCACTWPHHARVRVALPCTCARICHAQRPS